jgi:hypothetical protein
MLHWLRECSPGIYPNTVAFVSDAVRKLGNMIEEFLIHTMAELHHYDMQEHARPDIW